METKIILGTLILVSKFSFVLESTFLYLFRPYSQAVQGIMFRVILRFNIQWGINFVHYGNVANQISLEIWEAIGF